MAIKELKDTSDPTGVKEFVKEVKLMAGVGKHDHVVEFIGAFVERGGENQVKND